MAKSKYKARIKPRSYQPNEAELAEDVGIDARPLELACAELT